MTATATTARMSGVRELSVETTLLDDRRPLIPFTDAHDPLVWLRKGDGLIGIGSAARFEFSGVARMRNAAAAWQQLVSVATVRDDVKLPGSGLVAFGAFTFSADSAESSVLIVPEIVIGRRNGTTWITRIRPIVTEADSGAHAAGTASVSLNEKKRSAGTSATPPTPAPPGDEYRLSLLSATVKPDDYRRIVAGAIEHIRERDLAKVVLARDVTAHLPEGSDLRRALTRLALGYPDCWTYGVDGLIGSSPETLVRVNHGEVSARVLAGTISRGSDADSDREAAVALAASAKDQSEHRFAVQSVLSTLLPHSDSLVSSEVPFTLKLPNLWHLATDVRGELNDGSTSLDLIDSLHPTAAVAGTPTAEAVALIDELEPFDRGRYAGPVGWVGADGDGEWAIALRGAQISGSGTITAFAGAGIVAGSDPERELAETKIKFRPIAEAFG